MDLGETGFIPLEISKKIAVNVAETARHEHTYTFIPFIQASKMLHEEWKKDAQKELNDAYEFQDARKIPQMLYENFGMRVPDVVQKSAQRRCFVICSASIVLGIAVMPVTLCVAIVGSVAMGCVEIYKSIKR